MLRKTADAAAGGEALSAEILQALAHPLRIRILRALLECSCCQCNLATNLDEHPVNISRHLAILARAGLVTITKEGTKTYPVPAFPEIRQILDLAERLVRRMAAERAKEARAYGAKGLRTSPTAG
jgi:DNA-binding transcriptional ArsR family regulator